jgi:YidC/Oxa1 family membrane protein insertase
VALKTKYFLCALIPNELARSPVKIETKAVKNTSPDWGSYDWREHRVQLSMDFGENLEQERRFRVYLGPVDYDELRIPNVKLEKVVSFGLIRPLGIAFYYVLQFLHGLVGNYGLAIIIFSILIKVVLYPLTRKSFQSMRKMQALQPKISALREKYKDEPQKLNQETMKLYKQHGVNPMGGCLPLLLQMPVLFALFNLFRTTIMLRQASFLGIQDLSAPDGLIQGINLLPILMGITMIIQQRLTNKDPKQKAMAYFMPVFLGFIFYRLSAGLNLYYLMFNLLTIAQEIWIKPKEKTDQG